MKLHPVAATFRYQNLTLADQADLIAIERRYFGTAAPRATTFYGEAAFVSFNAISSSCERAEQTTRRDATALNCEGWLHEGADRQSVSSLNPLPVPPSLAP